MKIAKCFVGIGFLLFQVVTSDAISWISQTESSTFSASQTSSYSTRKDELKAVLFNFGQDTKAECEKLSTILRNVSDVKKYLENLENVTVSSSCKAMAMCSLRSTSELGRRCPAEIDSVRICFPETSSNATVRVSCPAMFRGISYNTSDQVHRHCTENGTWGNKTPYCRSTTEPPRWDASLKALVDLSLAGRIVSLISLLVAFFLFWKLKSIRCWRIIIHWNLTASLILKNVFWIGMRYGIGFDAFSKNEVFCRVLVTLFKYSHASNFFWMLVEGIYLYMMVVMAFVSNKIKLKYYYLIGWCGPTIVTLAWVVCKLVTENKVCWMVNKQTKPAYIVFVAPILLILLVNTLILASIIRVLFTKLRSQNNKEHLDLYWKATKAAIFLFPLLGGTYIIFLVSPKRGSIGETIFFYVNTILQSFQGFFVCIIYCFSNVEVRNAVKKKAQRWRTEHNIPFWGNYSRRSSLGQTTFNTTCMIKNSDEATIGHNRISSKNCSIPLHRQTEKQQFSTTEAVGLVTYESVVIDTNKNKDTTDML